MKLENFKNPPIKKVNKAVEKILDNADFFEDIAFVVPKILNYYEVIDEKVSVLPYASVGIVFDSVKFMNNIVDIVNDSKNLEKLEVIKKDFSSINFSNVNFSDTNLRQEIQIICKKNRNKDVKNAILNLSRAMGDVLCFSVATWVYGESIKVSSSVSEIVAEVYKYIRQKGRNKAKEKGVKSFYAKVFNMEKSTDDKIRKKCEIIRLIDEDFKDYINTNNLYLKNKKFKKLDLYVKILSRYEKSLGVKKDWSLILAKQEKNINKDSTNNACSHTKNDNSLDFVVPIVDTWQFQRVILMVEFLQDIKKALGEVSYKYSILNKLKAIKKDIKKNKQKYMNGEYELVKFLIKHNKNSFKNNTYQMTILGGNLLGEMGELVSYFKDTMLEITGLFAKLFSTVFGQCLKIKKGKKRKSKEISKNAIKIMRIVDSVESLNLEYESFYNQMSRLNIYLSELKLKWKDVANNDNKREIIESALI